METVLWVIGAVVVTATVGVQGKGDPVAMMGIASTGLALISLSFLAFIIFGYDGPDEKAPIIRKSLIGTAVGLGGLSTAYLIS